METARSTNLDLVDSHLGQITQVRELAVSLKPASLPIREISDRSKIQANPFKATVMSSMQRGSKKKGKKGT